MFILRKTYYTQLILSLVQSLPSRIDVTKPSIYDLITISIPTLIRSYLGLHTSSHSIAIWSNLYWGYLKHNEECVGFIVLLYFYDKYLCIVSYWRPIMFVSLIDHPSLLCDPINLPIMYHYSLTALSLPMTILREESLFLQNSVGICSIILIALNYNFIITTKNTFIMYYQKTCTIIITKNMSFDVILLNINGWWTC